MNDFVPMPNIHVNLDRLIPLVEKAPVLWDGTVEGYRNSKSTKIAWEEIHRKMYDNFDILSEAERAYIAKKITDKWTHARDCWQRAFKKQMKERMGDVHSRNHPIPPNEIKGRPDLKFLLKVYWRKYSKHIEVPIMKKPKLDFDSEAETVVNEKTFPGKIEIPKYLLKEISINHLSKQNTTETSNLSHYNEVEHKQHNTENDSEMPSVSNEEHEQGIEDETHMICDSESEPEDELESVTSDRPAKLDEHLLQTSKKLQVSSPTHLNQNEEDNEETPNSNQSLKPPIERTPYNIEHEDGKSCNIENQSRKIRRLVDNVDDILHAYFETLILHVRDLDDFQMLTFQSEVLRVIRNLKFPSNNSTYNNKHEDDKSCDTEYQSRKRRRQEDNVDDNLHAYFNTLIPHVRGFDGFQMLTFQSEVLLLIRSVKFLPNN